MCAYFIAESDLPSPSYIFNSVALSQGVGLIISLVILFFSVKESEKPVLKYYSLSVAIKCVYLIGLIMQSMAVSLELKIFWADIKTSAGLFLPYFWLIITTLFTLKRLPSKSVMTLLFFVPLVNIAVLYSDPYLHLYRISSEMVHGIGTYYQLHPTFGPWFYTVTLASIYAPLIFSVLLLLYAFSTAGRYGRMPYGLLLALTVLSILLTAPVFRQSSPYDVFGLLSPISLILNFMVLKRYSFMDMIPMAQKTAFDIIDSAVFIYDTKGRLVDANKAGEKLKSVIPADDAYQLCGYFSGTDRAEPVPQKLMTAKADDRCYSAVFYQVMHNNRVTEGYVVLVSDVTENMKLAEIEKEKEVVYQKGLIISDIHDSISGSVGIIGMIAENMLDSEEADTESVKRIKSIADDTHKEVRFMMNTYDRQNPTYEEMSGDIRHIGNIMTEDSGMAFSLKEEIAEDLMKTVVPFGIYVNIIRFFKECVVNAVKHSGASELNSVIKISDGDIIIEVRDNGTGFPADVKKGRGLKNMSRRMDMVEGTLNIKSDSGTEITCRIPIKD
ncbi:MAG: histidine kinase N-terminal 7TM domain-containing protein [Deferribacterales bacterium]